MMVCCRVMSLCACLLACLVYMGERPAHALPKTQAELREIFDGLTKTSIKHGDIPALFNPPTITVNDASNVYEDEEPMLLVAFPDGIGIRMYPQSTLVWHEVVNEYLRSRPYCVTYSPISGSFAAYESSVDNVDLIFDSEGRLYNNNSVLIDRNTGSLWLQLPGIAFDGPLAGKGLKQLPVLWTDWAHARKAFPKAQVVSRPRGTSRQYGKDPYGSYHAKDSYYQSDIIYYPLSRLLDRRLPPKTPVVGLEVENLFFAVDIGYVKKARSVNFFLGPLALLAVYDDAVGSVRVFKRNVWGEVALFRMENKQLVDIETGSKWNMDGLAVAGNLKGASLDAVFGVYAFWFAWAAMYPDTAVVPGPTVVPDSALVKGN